MKTFVYSKDPMTDIVVEADVTPLLKFGETVVNITPMPVSPVSPVSLLVTQQSAPTDPKIMLLMQGGDVNVTYGFQIVIQTDARLLTVQVATPVVGDNFVPYTTQDPNAYTDLVDTIQAGQSALGTAIFAFPPTIDPAGGYVVWEFLSEEGVVYSSGNAYDYQIQSNGLGNTVIARAVINCPSNVPESSVNSKYQLRYTLTLQPLDPSQQHVFYSYENVTVTGLTTTPLGTQDQIELRGKPAKLSIVLDKLYDNVVIELYKDNMVIGSSPVQQYERVSGGYYYSASLETNGLEASLEAYTVVWSYYNNVDPSSVYSESANLWVTTPAILTAVSDIKSRINKARTTLYGTSDLIFPSEVVMVWCRRGMDKFNGYAGVFTSFTMTNAKGPVREYWLMCCEAIALTSQELAEAEKAFDFQGAAISLNVDRSAAYGALADKIYGQLDNELKPVKQNLIIKGNTGGDGSADPSKLRNGAIGAVGITITPASPWGPQRAGLPYPIVGVFK
jgi:hypothetical protein